MQYITHKSDVIADCAVRF